MANRYLEQEQRFWMSVQKTEGCWIWTASTMSSGYGQIRWNKKTRPAHLVSYEIAGGEIPQGQQIDHLCRNRRCVNPAHLECVTAGQNVLRGVGPSAKNARKTHCPRGHLLAGDNLQNRKDGRRICKRCQQAQCRQWRLRTLAARAIESAGRR